VELFGTRGLWALTDEGGVVLALSRAVTTAVRSVQVGQVYAPPPPLARSQGVHEPPPRFTAPVLRAIDEHFAAGDTTAAADAERQHLLVLAIRGLQKARAKAHAIDRQLADADRSAKLREQADMMLAHAHSVPRGASSMTWTDPLDGRPHTIELDPAKPVTAQARALYDKARRLDDGRLITERRLAEARATIAALEPVAAALAGAGSDIGPARDALRALGLVQAPRQTARPRAKARSTAPEENFRRFVSAEGYPILVGRDNRQNDRLTMHTARGNDLWLHVGGGRPGSHVVVRLPKQKTASLETMLDAGTLAVHFSKARGQLRVDVVYTLKKHVRKPKGSPAGTVVPSQTKTITVRLDEARLRRLLDSASADDADRDG
jgi:predicted ribosome quality control (RQC) complex YloA/Tae2 family protein